MNSVVHIDKDEAEKDLENLSSIRHKKNMPHPKKNSHQEPQDLSPLVIDYWTDLIVEHLLISINLGELNLNKPVDIVDLVPGSGQSSWLILQILFKKTSKIDGLQLRYLPVISHRSWLASARQQSELSNAISSEQIVPMLWGEQSDDPCLLSPSGRSAWKPANPCILLVHDRWASLQQRLFAVHYGKLLEANFEFLKTGLASNQREHQWQAVTDMEWANGFLPLINRYMMQLNSSPVSFPIGALRLLDLLNAKASQGYLMLAASKGFTSDYGLRLCGFGKIVESYEQTGRVPVNFDFISHRLQQLGAQSKEIEFQGGYVFQVAVRDHANAEVRLANLTKNTDRGMFRYGPALVDAMRALGNNATLDSRLAIIKLSKFDPSVFLASHDALIATFLKCKNFDRAIWREVLECVWKNCIPIQKDNNSDRSLAVAAMHCGHWQLARKILQKRIHIFGNTAKDLANLAWCDARTGQIKKALKLSAAGLNLESDDALAKQVHQRITERLENWVGRWAIDLHDETTAISVEPLDQSHAEAYFYQYRDPQIAVMTGLPALTSLEETKKWIAEQSVDEDRVNFAVMHRDYGFVGYINLAVSNHASYFCFWMGVDFQGRGWATAASRLVCNYANKVGITILLTSAYSDNLRSIRTLERIGFVKIEVRASVPDHDRIFFSMIPGGLVDVNSVQELMNYYEREKLPLYFPEQKSDLNFCSNSDIQLN